MGRHRIDNRAALAWTIQQKTAAGHCLLAATFSFIGHCLGGCNRRCDMVSNLQLREP
jgi:hypothetical protein